MKKTILTLSIAAIATQFLATQATAAEPLMTFRFAADKTVFTTTELANSDAVVHGGLYIDNYTGIARLRMILKSDAPVIIENGDFTRDPSGALDANGDPLHAFFAKHSTAIYTKESLIDDDTNIILWAGPETNQLDAFHANGVISNANSSFLTFDYRIPQNTPAGDYQCYISQKVITNSAGFIEEDLDISDQTHQLKVDKDFKIPPLIFSVFSRGDVNCDGSVSIEDAQATLKLYVEQEVASRTLTDTEIAQIMNTVHIHASKYASDASQNGSLDVSDAQGILQYYVDSMSGNTSDWNDIFK